MLRNRTKRQCKKMSQLTKLWRKRNPHYHRDKMRLYRSGNHVRKHAATGRIAILGVMCKVPHVE
jgi:hypothetical protein